MDAEVVDARVRHPRRLAHESGDGAARHLEREHLARDRGDDLGRRDLEHRRERVAVEDHVQVLVERDARHDLVRHRVVRVPAGVLVRDTSGELLERRIGEALQHVHVVVVAGHHVLHPATLERDRIDVPRDDEVIADDDRVPALFGGPAVDPVLPCAVAFGEDLVDEAVVRGQVVFGEQVHLEGRLRDAGEPRLVRRPGLLVVVAPQPVRDVVVREPLLGNADVPVQEARDRRLDLGQERRVVVTGLHSGEIVAPDRPLRRRPRPSCAVPPADRGLALRAHVCGCDRPPA